MEKGGQQGKEGKRNWVAYVLQVQNENAESTSNKKSTNLQGSYYILLRQLLGQKRTKKWRDLS